MSKSQVMFVHHWGDLPLLPDTDSGIAAIEREQITKPRPVEVEVPKLYQPCASVKTEVIQLTDNIEDPYVLHTIQLHQHAKKLRAFLSSSSNHPESSLDIPEFPVIPKHCDCTVYKQTDDRYREAFVPPPEINLELSRKLMKKSISVVCAQIGYETSTDGVLTLLTDILHEYLKRIMHLLRKNVDQEALTGHTGFIDVMEQTLQEAGVGSIVTLQDFHHRRVTGYHRHILQGVQELLRDCEESMCVPEVKSVKEQKVVRESDSHIFEINFPVIQEVEDVYQEPTQIHLQLEELQSTVQNMDCDANTSIKDDIIGQVSPESRYKKDNSAMIVTPNLDTDDEIINVSDSPSSSGVSHI